MYKVIIFGIGNSLKKLEKIRMMHLNYHESENRACGHCSYRKIALENIDDHVDIIKEKLTRYFENNEVVEA